LSLPPDAALFLGRGLRRNWEPPSDRRCALYGRASSAENKAALHFQLDGLRQYARAKGYQIVHEVTEVASGLNDARPKLHALLQQQDFDVLIVEHKERLTRFGFHWFEALCPFAIEVITLAENGREDLMEDLVAILTSFSARLYGQRRGRQKTQAVIKALQEGGR
jgi:putative resolvase